MAQNRIGIVIETTESGSKAASATVTKNLDQIKSSAVQSSKAVGEAATSTTSATNTVASSLDVATPKASAFGQSLGRIRDVALGVYLPQLGLKLLSLGEDALKSTGDFEQSRVAFETMLGSAAKAQDLLTQISQFAKTTPFDLPGVVDASKQLLAYGFAQDQIIPTMTKLGDVAAGVSVPIGQLTAVYGQVRVAGKLMGQDLLQFTQAGVPLLDYLAQTMHKTAAQIKADMDAGVGPTFNDVQNALDAMTASGSKFGGLMDKQSHTFQGVMSNIGDAFGQIGRAALGMDTAGNIVKGSFFDRIKDAADSTMPILQDFANGVGPAVQQGMQILTDLAKQVGDYLTPKFSALGKALGEDVIPVFVDWWKNVVIPLNLAVGEAMVKAIGAAVDTITNTIKVVHQFADEFKIGAAVVTTVFAPAIVGAAVTTAVQTAKMVASAVVARTAWIVSATTISARWWIEAAKTVAAGASIAAKATVQAVATSAGWVKNAVIASASWVVETGKIIAAQALVALKSAPHAADTALAWTINAARVSFVWVTQELPKIVAAFAVTATQATVKAAAVSAVWIANAAKSSFAWVITELPKIVTGFVITSASAGTHAAISSAAWIASAAKTSFAWVVTELPKIVGAFVALAGSAVAQSAVASAAWVASAVVSSQSVGALQTLVATPMVMPAIAIGAALVAIAQVKAAYDDMKSAIEGAKTAAQNSIDITNQMIAKNQQIQNGPYSADVKARYQAATTAAMKADATSQSNTSALNDDFWKALFGIQSIPGRALGTTYSTGGATRVGEHGSEIVNLPAGSTVTPAYRSRTESSQSRAGHTVIVQNMNINNGGDQYRMLKDIGFALELAS